MKRKDNEMLKIRWIWKIEIWSEKLVDGHQINSPVPTWALFFLVGGGGERGQLSGSVPNAL